MEIWSRILYTQIENGIPFVREHTVQEYGFEKNATGSTNACDVPKAKSRTPRNRCFPEKPFEGPLRVILVEIRLSVPAAVPHAFRQYRGVTINPPLKDF